MNEYLKHDAWCIIEEGFNPENQRSSESIFSLGNGYIGQRANFEEQYSGDTLQGNYIAGIYYPDKTKVGWWKNGYPEYFAKVLNAPNWIGIDIKVGKDDLDLAKVKVENFRRVLNMKEGYLQRSFTAEFKNGNIIEVIAKRFISIKEKELGCIKYQVKGINVNDKITVTPFINANVINEDSNYQEKFWKEISIESKPGEAYVSVKTKKLDLVAQNPGNFLYWIADWQNKIKGAAGSNKQGGFDGFVRDDRTSEWRKIISWPLEDSTSSFIGLSKDGKCMYARDSKAWATLR